VFLADFAFKPNHRLSEANPPEGVRQTGAAGVGGLGRGLGVVFPPLHGLNAAREPPAHGSRKSLVSSVFLAGLRSNPITAFPRQTRLKACARPARPASVVSATGPAWFFHRPSG